MAASAERPWPIELRLDKSKTLLSVIYDDDQTFSLPAEYLRVQSPSAEVKGHGPGQENLVVGKERIKIVEIVSVGNYAVRIIFDDGHDSGLYSWDYLYELGHNQTKRWQAYMKAKRAAR